MGTNPIRKRRAIVMRGKDLLAGYVLLRNEWYAVCPRCETEVRDARAPYDMSSTRKRAKDALCRHQRTTTPSPVG